MTGHAPRLAGETLSRLRRRLDPDAVVSDPERLVGYATDALVHLEGSPLAVVRPSSREDLVAALDTLRQACVPYVARGAGSGLAGAAVARGAVVVSTERMDRILEIDPEERSATVEPGVVTARISEAAREHGLRYLPDPASEEYCTIGGNVAMNAGGAHCLKHGVTTDHVLALEVATPTGEVLRLDRGESGGLDLAGLLIGSEGTLGVVTRIVVRLVPRPSEVRTALALFDRVADAGRAVAEVFASGVVPVALELIDRAAIRAVEESPHAAGLPTDVAAALLIECEGLAEEAEAELLRAAEAVERAGAREILAAADEGQRRRLWKARKEAYHALEPLAPNVLVQDAAIPRSALAEVLPRILEIADSHDLPVVNFFHAGDGNLHPNLPYDASDPEEAARVEAASDAIMEVCVRTGGTITGEHGVGLDKREHMRLLFSERELELQRAVKRALDPRGLANADKLLPPPTPARCDGGEEADSGGGGGRGVPP